MDKQLIIKQNKHKEHTPVFKNVGLLYHPRLAGSRVMAAEISEFIESLGVSVWVRSGWHEKIVEEQLPDLDLIITLGGDGSMLRAVRMTASQAVPVLGVNMGRLGFLTEVHPAEWLDCIKHTLFGNYWIEKRMMVHARHYHNEQLVNSYEALNEVVISRGRVARVVRLKTYIDGSFLTTYTADGLIIATATGSTAYALAAGGPILPPELENFLLIPLAPHLSLERAIVLSKGAAVCTELSTDHTATLTIDGQIEVELTDGDKVIMSTSPCMGHFIRLREKNYFYSTLMGSLGWPESMKR